MKQCPNPNCIIYTRLDELPDTYLRCPKCDEKLVDVQVPTGLISIASFEDPSQARTSPYVPLRAAPAISSSHYTQRVFDDVEQQDFSGTQYEDPPLPLHYPDPYAAPPARRLPGVRAAIAGVGVLVLLILCAGMALMLRNRISPEQAVYSTTSATQTVLASLRPAVNTPIVLQPGGFLPGSAAQNPGSPPLPTAPPLAPGPSNSLPVTPLPPAQRPQTGGQAAPVLDAFMCARLEGGQPVERKGVYAPGDRFTLVVSADFGPGAVESILTRWYGPTGAQIHTLQQQYSRRAVYYSGFTLSKASPWPVGDYRVDIYTNGSAQPASAVTFSVR